MTIALSHCRNHGVRILYKQLYLDIMVEEVTSSDNSRGAIFRLTNNKGKTQRIYLEQGQGCRLTECLEFGLPQDNQPTAEDEVKIGYNLAKRYVVHRGKFASEGFIDYRREKF